MLTDQKLLLTLSTPLVLPLSWLWASAQLGPKGTKSTFEISVRNV